MRPFGMSLFSTLVSLVVLAGAAQADQVEMQNGDRYNGKILSLTNDTVVLQSELLGNAHREDGDVGFLQPGERLIKR